MEALSPLAIIRKLMDLKSNPPLFAIVIAEVALEAKLIWQCNVQQSNGYKCGTLVDVAVKNCPICGKPNPSPASIENSHTKWHNGYTLCGLQQSTSVLADSKDSTTCTVCKHRTELYGATEERK
jgi:hypothetical protein